MGHFGAIFGLKINSFEVSTKSVSWTPTVSHELSSVHSCISLFAYSQCKIS